VLINLNLDGLANYAILNTAGTEVLVELISTAELIELSSPMLLDLFMWHVQLQS